MVVQLAMSLIEGTIVEKHACDVACGPAGEGLETGADQFECNICLELAKEPVVTLCGHLFCWACLWRWMNCSAGLNRSCPCCKAGVEVDKVRPQLFGCAE